MRSVIVFHLLFVQVLQTGITADSNLGKKKGSRKKLKIAVIGGGVGGSFVSKYLTDYDLDCNAIDSITLLDPFSYYSPLSTAEENAARTKPITYPFYIGDVEDQKAEINSSSSGRLRIDTVHKPPEIPPASQESMQPQGGRVSTLILSDGTPVELGASIIYEGNTLVMEMIRNDPTLQVGSPHGTPSNHNLNNNQTTNGVHSNTQDDNSTDTELSNSWGIFNGFQGLSWPLFIPSHMSSFHKRLVFLWRYHYDLFRIQRATDRAFQSFRRIYDLLEDTSLTRIKLDSPEDIWKAVGLWKVAHCSFDALLNQLGFQSWTYFYEEQSSMLPFLSWWKRIVDRMVGVTLGRSLLRHELLTAINLANNNQGNDRMTGLAGLVNFLASRGPLFSIVGGNYKLIQSATQQANENRKQSCALGQVSSSSIIHIPTRVKTVISEAHNREQAIDLYDINGNALGESFNVVILAAPLQFADIDFLVKGSLFDSDVLYTMPLHGRVLVNEDESFVDANEHGHYHAIQTLPPSAQRPYTQVVTTVVANATLQASAINFDDITRDIPSSIVFTQNGQKALHGINAIRKLGLDGVYKIFSSTSVDQFFLQKLFGTGVTVDYVQVWGGLHGGATPNFNGGKLVDSPPFLLFDSAMHGDSTDFDGSTLYYLNGMETAVSAMEISAIGAKAVAKMIASRYGFLHPAAVGNIIAEEL